MSKFDSVLLTAGWEHVEPFTVDKKIIGYISIHNTNLGPALGGTRVFAYKNANQALKDSINLSRAMTYKCAIAGLPFGGGKGVIAVNPTRKDLKKILRQYAKNVNKLDGKFYTGEDVGLSEENVQYMLKYSPFFIGKSHLAGDPSPFAAKSAFLCAQLANKQVNGTESFLGKTVIVKGIGKTGSALAKLFIGDGARVVIADINRAAIKNFTMNEPSVRVVPVKDIMSTKADLYAPCALGSDLDGKNINKLKVKMVVGTANNQLESMDVAENLYRLGILHIPDYIANAGGLINVADELLTGGYNRDRVERNIKNLRNTLTEVLKESSRLHRNPTMIANEIAEKIFLRNKPGVVKQKIIQSLNKVMSNLKNALPT